MATQSPQLTDRLPAFIEAQKVFFVAAAARDGTARAVHAADPQWQQLLGMFAPRRAAKTTFALSIDLVQTFCGYGVPLFEFVAEREPMGCWAAKKGPGGLHAYRQENNRASLNGYPTGLPPTGLDSSRSAAGTTS